MRTPLLALAGRAGRAASRLLRDRDYRALALLRAFRADQLHQTTAFTALDRYPEIFGQCRDLLQGREDLRILSFGCSTGEEVATLRGYFPTAFIVGADLNPESLRRARTHHADAKIRYVRSDDRALAALGPFDIIFCMAVLQRTPHRIEAEGVEDISAIYPFGKFEKLVAQLVANLKRGGLLVVEHAFYRVEDVRLAVPLRPVASPHLGPSTWLFDPSGRLMRGAARSCVIFEKPA